jgi:hypothetical protein
VTTANSTRRNVHVRRGQTVIVDAGRNVTLEVWREQPDAVVVRNLATGNIIRQWAPKEASER